MSLQIIDCAQNSEEWRLARCGIPTASEFASVLAKGEGKTRRTYMMKLAGEIVTGQPMQGFQSADMERGHALEGDARDLYAFMTGTEPQLVGFCRNGNTGCSPDSLVGEDGLLEIKTKAPHLLAEVIIRDTFPSDHRAQCQGALWVTGRKWIDIACYWPGMPLFIKRAERDEEYIVELAREVGRFNAELAEAVAKIRAYGGMREAA